MRGGGHVRVRPFQGRVHAEAPAGRGEGVEAQRVDMGPPEREPGGVAEVARGEVLRGEAPDGGMVAGDARELDVGPVDGQVDDGHAVAADPFHEIRRRGVRPERHEHAVPAPHGRLVAQAVLHHQVSAVFFRVVGDARQAGAAGRGEIITGTFCCLMAQV